KTGCKTCKLRRLKCDEARPACHRCLYSGRVCAGYGVWGGGSIHTHFNDYMPTYWRSSALSQHNPEVSLLEMSREDKAIFDFFCKCPTLKISGMFKSDFWDHLLIQTSTVEPAVFHAVLAIGSAYRARIVRFETRAPNDSTSLQSTVQLHKSLSLQHYNKAIQQLYRLLERNDASSLRVAAATCVLFICLEILQRQRQSLERHYHYGAVLLQEIRKLPRQPDDKHLSQAFTRLSLHLDLFFHHSPSLRTASCTHISELSTSIPPIFNSVRSARLSLEQLLIATLDLEGQIEAADSDTSEASADIMRKYAVLQHSMSVWKEAYHCSTKSVFAKFSILELISVRLLRNYHTMASIILGTCLSRSRQISYDAFTSSFASILSQFEEVLSLIGWYEPNVLSPSICGDNLEASFSLDMGSLPPILFLALKCRDPAIRRKAIHMLEMCRHREGMWTGPMLSRVAAKVMALEE
ncbi:hypothetical protein GQ53DRAFT_623578, partial [Thozetella sp. PMI_491]